MNKKRLLHLGLGWALFGSPALSADPLVIIPTGNLACFVTATSDLPAPPAPSVPSDPNLPKPKAPDWAVIKTIEITRVGKLRHDVITWSDGTNSETWIWAEFGLLLAERSVNGHPSINTAPMGSITTQRFEPPILNFDAASVAWITDQSRDSVKETPDGKPAIHYLTVFTIPGGPGEPPRKIVCQAWIDPKTFVPLAFDDGDYVYNLAFAKDPPDVPLVPPDRFQKELQRYLNASATLRHL